MNKYKEGTVFELYDNDDRKFIVLKHVEIEGVDYLVVTPVNDKEEKVKINPTGVLLLSVDKETDNINFEYNKEIIAKVVNSMFEI